MIGLGRAAQSLAAHNGAGTMLPISPERVCHAIAKAREQDALEHLQVGGEAYPQWLRQLAHSWEVKEADDALPEFPLGLRGGLAPMRL
jgi:hypothetical protein